jgi:hypothetical protein
MDAHARRTHTARRQPRVLASDEARPHAHVSMPSWTWMAAASARAGMIEHAMRFPPVRSRMV